MPYEQYNQVETEVLSMPYEQKINLLSFIAESLRTPPVQKKDNAIEERLGFLSKNLDEDQDTNLFNLSVSLFRSVEPRLYYEKSPRLGVDDSGALVAEWNNYGEYEIISIRFGGEKQISLVAIKKDKVVTKTIGVPSEIVNSFNRL